MNERQKKAFHRNLWLYFKASKVKRKVFADMIGIKPPYLTDLLNGKKSGERIIWQVAERLNVPICQLISNHPLEIHQLLEKITKASREKRNKIQKILDS